jgi:hypothetical protein
VQMAKSDPETQRNFSLSDCTWLERWVWILNLKHLRFLIHFREPGSLLYFIFINSYFLSYIFFLFFLHLFLFFFIHIIFSLTIFLFPPLEL